MRDTRVGWVGYWLLGRSGVGGILEWGWDTRVGWVGYWLLGRILEWGGWDTRVGVGY